jgi:enoyl-CoA hydratase/carnithine racemase
VDYEFIKVAREDDIAVVTLNRPEKYNAWHAPMRVEVADALRALNADDGVRAIIITGAGDKAFGAGQDLAESQAFDGARAIEWMDEWKNLYGSVRELDKPIVAALNGVAAGSAFQLALLCDFRVGHAGSRMGQTEINSGIPSVTGTWLMWDVLGRAQTVEMVMTGKMIDGDEAYRLGLLNHLVPQSEVMTKARAVATELAAKPPIAMKLNKRRFRQLTEPGFLEAEAAGKVIQSEAFASGEPQEMMGRFFADRAAKKTPGRV